MNTEPAPTRLLLVDDEPSLREPLAEYLTRQGFVVRQAEDAAKARSALLEDTPDLVLLDMVQGREAHLFDRAVDNQVSRLRRKMEVDSRDPRLIQTVWGGGYRLAADVRRVSLSAG